MDNSIQDNTPSNEDRASWAEAALLAFATRTGMARDALGDSENLFLVVADLLADLAHWCDRKNVDLQSALEYAAKHYRAETGSQGNQLR